MISEIFFAFAGLVAFAYGLQWLKSSFDDSREPPRVHPKIPLFGHLAGMIQRGVDYYTLASQQTEADIFTLDVIGTKFYISKTHRLMSAIQKSSKTLSFKPFIRTAARRMGGASQATVDKLTDPVIDDFSHVMKSTLAPGADLDAQNLRMGNRVLVDIDALIEDGTNSEIMLHEWVKHAVVQASSCGILGVQHPFLDQKVEDAFWLWQTYLLQHMAGLDVTGRGYAAREVVVNAFIKYCKSTPSDAAPVITERSRILREAGFSELEVAKQQGTFGTAAYANTVPTLYWTIHELYSRPDLVAAVRQEILSTSVSGSKEKGFALDVSAVKTKCPLTLSVLQETQRTRHVHANIRKVSEDTLLDGKYLLKKGNFLQMPGQPVHREKSVWGDSADVFDPYRFVPSDDKKPVPPSSFVAWGAPPHLCPARQFATTEVMIVIALLVIRVDITPASGVWEKAPAVNKSDLITLHNPLKDVGVRVKSRDDWAGAWGLKMGESKMRVSLASG
ncbi:Cytochrome P450-like protein 38 [Elsinoe fawcettii]|nr:Cytochrome P450-like protein 38 [Elsinoe fawcettii]